MKHIMNLKHDAGALRHARQCAVGIESRYDFCIVTKRPATRPSACCDMALCAWPGRGARAV